MNRVQGIILIVVASFLAASLFSYTNADPPDSLAFPAAETYENLCGKWGANAASMLLNGLGVAAYLVFVPLVVAIYFRWHNKPIDQIFLRMLGWALIFTGTASIACLSMTDEWHGPIIGPGGYVGVTLVYLLNGYFSQVGMTILFVCILLGGLVLACDYSIMRIVLWVSGLQPIDTNSAQESVKREKLPKVQPDPTVRTLREVKNRNAEIDETGEDEGFTKTERHEQTYIDGDGGEVDEEEEGDWDDEEHADESDWDELEEDEEDEEYPEDESDEEWEDEPDDAPVEQPTQKSKGLISWLKIKRPKEDAEQDVEPEHDAGESEEFEEEEIEYDLPPVELLIESEKHDYDQQMQIARRQAKQLEKAFADFGLNIKVVDIQCGPVIAQFEVELERGLRLNKIINLTDDLAIALRVPTVRIVAPIPGKNTVGVEVPNATRQLVRLREVIEEMPDKAKSKAAIPIFLGKDVAGAPMMIDLSKMPHLLIAGRTGTGKSVCLNSIIVSILMTKTPEECRMIMIDPKMVELSQYESIPHLMHPVVIDMKKAEAILAWAVDKMEQRYQILNRAKVRQLSEYNALSEEELYRRVKPETQEEWDETPRSLPYMVIVVDEMADLMMTAAKEVETHIIRIAQKSRAVGIHLVLATQKPTVDIITGLIKSNLPARIAFEVATRTDSQVVLDRNGAEKLLGNGDMLFLKPGTSQVLRGQGTYVSDPEINEVIGSIATDSPNYVIELVELQTGDESPENAMLDPRDDLFNEAVEYIIREGRGSVSLLQRKFKVGYGRAARLVDFMEEDGIVGPSKGSQPRDVILTLQQWRGRLAELENTLNPSKAVDRQAAPRPAEMNHPPKPKGMFVDKPPEKNAKPPRENEPYEIDDTSIDRLPLDRARNRQHDKQHDRHDSGRDSKPKTRRHMEPGLGPVADVDDSMLAEVRPNGGRRKLTPHQRRPDRDEERPPLDVYDGAEYDVGDACAEVDGNAFGVVPVADGDVPFDADDEWEYEYEYVYEEVDDEEGNESDDEWFEDDVDPKKRYVEEMNIEAGGEWESEEDWDDEDTEDEPGDENYNDEDYDEEEYDAEDYGYDEDDWDEDESDGKN